MILEKKMDSSLSCYKDCVQEEPIGAMNKRSYSEADIFRRSHDYTVPYIDCNGKNGMELALELNSDGINSPFDEEGRVHIAPSSNISFRSMMATVYDKTDDDSNTNRKSAMYIESDLDGEGSLVKSGREKYERSACSSSRTSSLSSGLTLSLNSEIELISSVVDMNKYPPSSDVVSMIEGESKESNVVVDGNEMKIHNDHHSPDQQAEKEMKEQSGQFLKLSRLVGLYAQETQELDMIRYLIVAHEQFVQSKSLLEEFLRYFKEHQSEDSSGQAVQARILNILKRWVELAWDSIVRNELDVILQNFLNDISRTHPKHCRILQNALVFARGAEPFCYDRIYGLFNARVKDPDLIRNLPWFYGEFTSLDFARQLTLIDWDLASEVSTSELVHCRWMEGKAPTLSKTVSRVNNMAFWIAFQVVNIRNLKKRCKVLMRIIKIAKHLLALRSFNSFMAIYLAMNFQSITRLTHTWKNIGSKELSVWKKISSIMSPVQNFYNYRKLIRGCSPPMVLCQEVLLKDLLFQEECINPSEEGEFDMIKLESIGQLIVLFRKCQVTPYPIQREASLSNFLNQMPHWDLTDDAVKALNQQSLLIQPDRLDHSKEVNPVP